MQFSITLPRLSFLVIVRLGVFHLVVFLCGFFVVVLVLFLFIWLVGISTQMQLLGACEICASFSAPPGGGILSSRKCATPPKVLTGWRPTASIEVLFKHHFLVNVSVSVHIVYTCSVVLGSSDLASCLADGFLMLWWGKAGGEDGMEGGEGKTSVNKIIRAAGS